MAIKTNGSGEKKVAGSTVENSEKLWKAAGQLWAKWPQLYLSHRLAGTMDSGRCSDRKGAESGKLGRFSHFSMKRCPGAKLIFEVRQKHHWSGCSTWNYPIGVSPLTQLLQMT